MNNPESRNIYGMYRLTEPDQWGYTQLPLALIYSNTNNSRRVYPRIKALADSIKEVGLLQNLVVIETDKGWEIKGGERRYRAIKMLAEQGIWKGDVPCLVINHQIADIANAAENCARLEVPVWHLGNRFLELHEGGYTQEQIAESIGKSQQYVSYAINIASNTHPEVIAKLDKLDSSLVTARILRQLCRLTTEGEPDLTAQMAFLTRMIEARKCGKSAGRPKGSKSKTNIAKRLDLLEALPISPLQAPIVRAVIHYLKGESSELLL